MSSSEEESDFQASDSGSDTYQVEVSVKKPKATTTKKVVTAPAIKVKPAPKPKAVAAVTKKVTKVKKVLEEHQSNGTDSEAEGNVNMPDVEDEDTVGLLAGPSTTTAAVKLAATKKKTASETYQKLSQVDHVLQRPDTYIGSVESITSPMWVYDAPSKGLAYRSITYVPGLYKIVDEILVNAADNKVRDKEMTTMRVTIDPETNTISVWNDGAGIPIVLHDTEKVWIPELIFGHLLTSSNYDDNEAKVTGGRNGYGAKLANIYSTEFTVDTADTKTGKKYLQTFSKNMSEKTKPKITENKKEENYTQISFKPDLKRFGMETLDEDLVSLLSKRVYDMAGITKGIKVYLNGKKVTVTSFKAYVGMFTNGLNEVTSDKKKSTGATVELLTVPGAEPVKPTILSEKFGDRWEVAFAISDGQFQQVSYCNSIATTKGGKHVDFIADKIVGHILEAVKKKNSKANLKPHQIKSHLSLYVNCLVENPSFDSQTKENMTLSIVKFSKTCVISDDFIKKIMKSGVIDNILSFAAFQAEKGLAKTDGKKRNRITGQNKLEDANLAGTKSSNQCTLILTEGDSAKALVISGYGPRGLSRDHYGVYPLRGKLLNVRDAPLENVSKNAEIIAIKQIMGLRSGQNYNNTDSLRYGSIMIMADQDHDGSHIKGLIINFFDHFFPTLLKIPGFLVEFITPIVKVTKGKKQLSFFTLPQYELWKEETDNGRGWEIKYFKGLGTSTSKDALVYFNALNIHKIPFQVSSADDRELIDKAFNKKRADDRKTWLAQADPEAHMDHAVKAIPIGDFVNKELILFSIADCVRSIPSVVDGFKPGQRKVLFGCFLKNMKKEVKVAQLSGFIGEKSAYHHGEVSLQGTIIGLAQTYLGSNNINLLLPNGQFGTRLQGGKDAASARYIFTALHTLARVIFQPADDNVLSYLNDDGYSIEPKWYVPILPMVLVNGSDGIGTGWSSTIQSYNPAELVANLKRKMAGEEMVPMHPWYRGFLGTVEKAEKDSYKITGLISLVDEETVEITELPLRLWTQTYKEQLEAWVEGKEKTPALVKDYKEYHTDKTVHFIISLTDKGKAAIARDGLEKTFKMTSKVSTSNMVCFDPAGKIKKYATTEEILLEFYDVRLEFYHKRKAFLVAQLGDIHKKLTNQARFIKMIVEEKLKLSKKKRAAIVLELSALNFARYPKAKKEAGVPDPDAPEEEEEEEGSDSDYDYLLNMALASLTAEKVAKLLAECAKKEEELTALLKLTAQDLWTRDLDDFSEKWEAALELDIAEAKTGAVKGGKGKGKKRAVSEDDEDFDEEFDYKPVKKIRGPVVKKKEPLPMSEDEAPVKPVVAKKKIPLPDSEDDLPPPPPVKTIVKKKIALPSSDDDEPVVVKAKIVPAEVVKPKPVAKRLSISISDDEEEMVAKPKKVVKKQKVVESDDEDDMYAEPSVWPPVPSPKAKAPIVKAVAAKTAVVKAKAVPKPKAKMVSLSSDESDDAFVKKAPVKKAAPKVTKKVVATSEEEDLSDTPVVAAPKGRRTAAVKKPAYVMEVSDEEDQSMLKDDSESDFNEDSD